MCRAAAGRTGGVKIPPLDLDRLVHVVHAEAHLVGAGSSAAPLAALYMLVYVNGCHAAGTRRQMGPCVLCFMFCTFCHQVKWYRHHGCVEWTW